MSSRDPRRPVGGPVPALLTLLLVCAAVPVRAADISVDTTADEAATPPNGACSLREAVIAANTGVAVDGCAPGTLAGADRILLPAGTYALTLAGAEEYLPAPASGDLDVLDELVIEGAGAASTIIDATGLGDRVFEVIDDPVGPGPQAGNGSAGLTLRDVTVRGGTAPYGGLIRAVDADLAIEDAALELGKVAYNGPGTGGGAIFALGDGVPVTVSVTRSQIANNDASGSDLGGGGLLLEGDVRATVADSVVQQNAAGYGALGGGGVAVYSGAEAIIERTALVQNDGTWARGGGSAVLAQFGDVTIENSTVSGNVDTLGIAAAPLVAVDSRGTLAVRHVTIADNIGETATGIVSLGAPVTIEGSVVAGTCVRIEAESSFTTLGGNVESPGDTCGFEDGALDDVSVSAEALALEPVADDGGTTVMWALGSTSVARDAIASPCAVAVDQRNLPRPAGPGCDSGAFEAQELLLIQPEPPSTIRFCDQVSLAASGLTGSPKLKIFLATATGALDVTPTGISPTSIDADTWTGQLPCPWQVPAPNDDLLGNGFAALMLELNGDTSNVVGIPILGNAGQQQPTILAIGGTFLSDSSWSPGIAVANVETIVPRLTPIVIAGEGFDDPVVNVFAANGNCGPIVPDQQAVDSITVTLPGACATGPASFQVVNRVGGFRASNAVSAPLGAAVTISSIDVGTPAPNGGDPGAVVTVTGTGFSPLTVINLFATSSTTAQVENFGGLDGSGDANLPLTFVDDTTLELTLPADAAAGAAFVEAINPPYIPFSRSGTGPSGSFTIP